MVNFFNSKFYDFREEQACLNMHLETIYELAILLGEIYEEDNQNTYIKFFNKNHNSIYDILREEFNEYFYKQRYFDINEQIQNHIEEENDSLTSEELFAKIIEEAEWVFDKFIESIDGKYIETIYEKWNINYKKNGKEYSLNFSQYIPKVLKKIDLTMKKVINDKIPHIWINCNDYNRPYDRSGTTELISFKEMIDIADERTLVGFKEFTVLDNIYTGHWEPTYERGFGKHWVTYLEMVKGLMTNKYLNGELKNNLLKDLYNISYKEVDYKDILDNEEIKSLEDSLFKIKGLIEILIFYTSTKIDADYILEVLPFLKE